MTVTLSRTTLDVLKNYATINSSIVFRKGNKLRTISNAENILSQFTSEETFPTDFAIYDLSQFLSGISLFDNPRLDFTSDDFVRIAGAGRSVKYYFSDPEITLKSAPEKNVKFPGSDIQFSLTAEDLVNIQKASAVYSLPDLTFYSEEGSDVIKLILRDKENDTSNTYDLSVKGTATGTFSLDLKIENIRVLPSDYVVKVSQHLISEWTSQDADLKYYIALEPA